MPQDAEPIRTTLVEMNHPQPPTPIQVENSTAVGISNKAIKQRMSKAMDIRFYRIWYRIKQEQFIVYWNPGKDNLGNYPTTHQSPAYHITARPVYFHEPKVSTVTLQGGVNYDKSARTACMLSLSFGHKIRTSPVLSPSYGNNACTVCMLSQPFGYIMSPVGRYVRQSA